jgi:hypothetical protein
VGVSLAEWVRLLDQEYLTDFIASGGAAVKLAVAPDIDGVPTALATVGGPALEQNYLIAWVDAAHTRVNMIDKIFFAVAQQVDWRLIMERWMRERLREAGYRVPEDSADALPDLDLLAEENDVDRPQLVAEVRRWIHNGLLKDYRLAKDFRTALAMFAWGLTAPQNVTPNDADVVRQWLRGEPCSLAVLKRMQIHQRISRQNARLMLASLAAFLPRVGYAGLVILLDLRPVVSDSPVEVGGLRYSRSASQDTYEILRQFIDDTDEMSHFLLIAAAGPGLVDNDRRGLNSYTALKLRTSDEVRDRDRPNPLGALVRLDVP